jgi:hypothetical protein
MSNPQSPKQAIRALLFRNAETANQHMLKRLGDVARHLSKTNDRAVIGALDGMESEVERVRTMMVLARDHFPAENSKE